MDESIIMEDSFTCTPEYFESFMTKTKRKDRIYPVHVNENDTLLLSWELVYRVHVFAGDLAYMLIKATYQDICKKEPMILWDDRKLIAVLSEKLEEGLKKYG